MTATRALGRFNGTAPLPASSGEGDGEPVRHRLTRAERAVNAVLHRMAVTQLGQKPQEPAASGQPALRRLTARPRRGCRPPSVTVLDRLRELDYQSGLRPRPGAGPPAVKPLSPARVWLIRSIFLADVVLAIGLFAGAVAWGSWLPIVPLVGPLFQVPLMKPQHLRQVFGLADVRSRPEAGSGSQQ